MPARNVAQAIAKLAPGKRVTVLMPKGMCALPTEKPAIELNPLEKQLLERDAETRATVASCFARVEETVSALHRSVETVDRRQAQVERSVSEISEKLDQPVKPVYDAAGKLLCAQRVKKL